MGCCFSAHVASFEPAPSSWDRDEYEWEIGRQRHQINQLKVQIRQQGTLDSGSRQEADGIGLVRGRNILTRVALSHGQLHANLGSRKLLQDLAVLNYHQRETLDTFANVRPLPLRDPCAQRVRFN